MAEKATIYDLDDVQAFLNKEDCLARLKYLGKQELVLVSAYLEIKIRASDSRVENLSKVHKHLTAEEKQESEAQITKESEEVASTEKEDKGSDIDSDADLKTYLKEQQVETLRAAATMAEEYILTHRPSARYVPKTYSRYPAKHKPEDKIAPRSSAKSTPDSPRRISPKRDIICLTCGKKGHIAVRCRSSTGNNPHREIMLINSIVPPTSTLEKRKELFAPYTSQGYVSSDHSGKPVVVLRDSGAAHSLILENSLPEGISANGMQKVILGGFPSTLYVAPLVQVHLESQHFKGECRLAMVDSLLIKGINVILANDLALGLLPNCPVVVEDPVCEETSPIAAVQTRSQAQFQVPPDLSTLFDSPPIPQVTSSHTPVPPVLLPVPERWTRARLIEEQRKNPQVQKLVNTLDSPTKGGDLYVWSSDVLCRRHPPKYPQSTEVGEQIVVPAVFRSKLLETAHADRFAGHGGVSKTFQRLAKCFYWPHMKKDVRRFCKTCHTCHIAGKANKPVPKAPICPIPSIGEPFEHLILDIVGPLPPSTSGVQYLLTILDRITSSANHPESQGVLERFHQTLKGMLRKFCYDRQSKWVEDLPYLLFEARSVPNESLGISPFEIYGHSVRGPLEVARDHWLDKETNEDVVDWLSTNKGRLFSAWEMAKKTLEDRLKKETLVHVNMIKKYEGRDTLPITMVTTKDDIAEDEEVLTHSEILHKLQVKLTCGRRRSTIIAANDRKVNKVTVADTYPLPRVEECLDAIGKASYLTKFDLFKGYWTIYVTEDFFKAILQSGLVVNLHKSEFARTSVVFLGHKVGGGWIAPNASKVEAIVQYPTPATRKDILRFLGMAGFYRKFVPNFSSITAPLTNLLKKGVQLLWNENCQDAFESLKAILISSPILTSPSFEDRFILTVDASDYGPGAVLSQTDEKGVEHPVAYHSKKLTPSQLNYSVIEKETLALISSVQHFEVYLTSNSHPILVRTDHNPLKFLAQFRQKNLRLTRWSLHLQQYPLHIEHMKGVDNVVADALSRI
ncbi:uncharacterized protein [Procambarus clarkii]|uniref:uncharacterized protein n=1 Tax=Procambarus clarkii TaxID=6728 RepID=UPI003742C2F3